MEQALFYIVSFVGAFTIARAVMEFVEYIDKH